MAGKLQVAWNFEGEISISSNLFNLELICSLKSTFWFIKK